MEFDRNAVFPTPQESGSQGSHPNPTGQQAPGAMYGPHTGPQGTPGYPAPPVPGYPAGYAPGYPAPPAPEGTSVLRALQASLVWAGVVLVVVFSLGDVPLSGYGLGALLGRLLPISLVSGLLVRLFVKRKRIAFGWLVLASLPTFIVSFLFIGVILMAGQQASR